MGSNPSTATLRPHRIGVSPSRSHREESGALPDAVANLDTRNVLVCLSLLDSNNSGMTNIILSGDFSLIKTVLFKETKNFSYLIVG